MSLDRFAVGLADPQENEAEVIGECSHCGDELHKGYRHGRIEDTYFCDKVCFGNYAADEMGYQEVG